MTDFTKFEFGASFEVLWLKSPTSPGPKTLSATLTDHTNYKMTTKYFDKLLAEISKTGKPNIEDNEYISQFFVPINSTRNSILEEQDKIPEYL
jgi:hypothetical protein